MHCGSLTLKVMRILPYTIPDNTTTIVMQHLIGKERQTYRHCINYYYSMAGP